MKKSKQYVVAIENQFVATGYEYFDYDPKEKTLVGHHSPKAAAIFLSVAEAKRFIERFITFEDVKILPFAPEEKKFNDWAEGGYVYRQLPAKNASVSRKYNGESKKEILKWWIQEARSKDFEVSQDDHDSWPNLYEKFKHIHAVNAFQDGSITFEFSFSSKSKFSEFKKEFDLVSPYCTHGTRKIYNVFDHYLSQGGNCVSLIDRGDGSFSVESSLGPIMVSGDLETCFEYLNRERWYDI